MGEAEAQTVKSVKSLSYSRNEKLLQLSLNRYKLTKTLEFISLSSKDLQHQEGSSTCITEAVRKLPDIPASQIL